MTEQEKLDENGNPIVDENDIDNQEGSDLQDQEQNQEQNQDQDDKDEQLKVERAKRLRAEANFKKMAKQFNEIKKTGNLNQDVEQLVSKKVAEEMYYANNPTAKEFQKEIKEIQEKTGMTPDDAMTFYLAKNKPELLGKKTEVGVDGTSNTIEQKKDIKDMTYEELWGSEKKRG